MKRIKQAVSFLVMTLILIMTSSAFAQGDKPIRGVHYEIIPSQGVNRLMASARGIEITEENTYVLLKAGVNINTHLLAKQMDTDPYSLRADNPLSTVAMCDMTGKGNYQHRAHGFKSRASNEIWENCSPDRQYVFVPPGELLVFRGKRHLSFNEMKQIHKELDACTDAKCACENVQLLAQNVEWWNCEVLGAYAPAAPSVAPPTSSGPMPPSPTGPEAPGALETEAGPAIAATVETKTPRWVWPAILGFVFLAFVIGFAVRGGNGPTDEKLSEQTREELEKTRGEFESALAANAILQGQKAKVEENYQALAEQAREAFAQVYEFLFGETHRLRTKKISTFIEEIMVLFEERTAAYHDGTLALASAVNSGKTVSSHGYMDPVALAKLVPQIEMLRKASTDRQIVATNADAAANAAALTVKEKNLAVQRMKEAQQERDAIAAKLTGLEAQIRDLEAKLEEHKKSRGTAESSVQSAQAEADSLRKLLEEAHAKLQDANATAYREERDQARVERDKLRDHVGNLIDLMFDEALGVPAPRDLCIETNTDTQYKGARSAIRDAIKADVEHAKGVVRKIDGARVNGIRTAHQALTRIEEKIGELVTVLHANSRLLTDKEFDDLVGYVRCFDPERELGELSRKCVELEQLLEEKERAHSISGEGLVDMDRLGMGVELRELRKERDKLRNAQLELETRLREIESVSYVTDLENDVSILTDLTSKFDRENAMLQVRTEELTTEVATLRKKLAASVPVTALKPEVPVAADPAEESAEILISNDSAEESAEAPISKRTLLPPDGDASAPNGGIDTRSPLRRNLFGALGQWLDLFEGQHPSRVEDTSELPIFQRLAAFVCDRSLVYPGHDGEDHDFKCVQLLQESFWNKFRRLPIRAVS